MNIIEALEDSSVFQKLFKDPKTWNAWHVFLKALFGISMAKDEKKLFNAATGLSSPYSSKITEAWVLVGRRGGKSFISSILAVYLAVFKDWSEYLIAGERPYIFVISVTKFQARSIKDYVLGILRSNPSLERMIENVRADEIDLTNGITISCQACSYRGIRGKTVLCAILEEVSFWRWQSESAVPDVEVVRALSPALGSIPESLLISISSPYVAQGIMAKKFSKYYGKSGPVLCWKADTRTMNPTFSQKIIDAAYQDDPEGARSEYGAEWRQDISAFIELAVIEAAVAAGRYEQAPVKEIEYVGVIDPSGGRSDSFCMSIAHRSAESGRVVQDVLREARPPFKPENVCEKFTEIFKRYRIFKIWSDRYAGEWVTSAFKDLGIDVIPATKSKSEYYLELLPLINNGQVEILDQERLKSQLGSLQRKTRSAGKDMIDNFLGSGHDDCANVCAMACVSVAEKEDEEEGQVYHAGMGQTTKYMKKEKPVADPEERIDEDEGEVYTPGRGENLNAEISNIVRSWGKK